ncbi:T9SS type A sorting domain-containing protein [Flavobacterium paronense]|uniref:T9SS type A sorting domain-containing protein n=1 Tax=Flavobacterium paronense TaxID=1392775 RepID=A0ABV5GHH2_9FLAO|nr:T9SS type A sorting domain-containing protein [Flavobacterium paronense]MDN3676441.1 T9SS type A sorting domain-containing protein [Flavobacterium paronense]
MKKLLLLGYIILLGETAFSQVQIGNDIDGNALCYGGGTVALSQDGSVLAIGVSKPQVGDQPRGAVRVYRKFLNAWVQIGNDINGFAPADAFGYSLDISDDGAIVAIGAYGYGNQGGAVQIFQNNNDNWVLMGFGIGGETAAGYSGTAISLSSNGTIVAIAAPANAGTNGEGLLGCVRVYQFTNGEWYKIGNNIYGEAAGDYSGASVSLSSDGSKVAIGAPFNDGNGVDSGHVRVYQNLNGNWVQQGNDINGEAANDYSGNFISLSANGSIIAIGAERNDNVVGLNNGHVRVYQYSSTVWTQIGSDINGVYKASLSANGQILATGSPNSFENGSFGTAKIYKNVSNNWVQLGTNIVGENPNDYSTSSMNLSQDGGTIAIAANNNNVYGHVRVYNLTPLLATNSLVKNNVAIFPNPAQYYFELNGDQTIKSVQIYSMLGQLVKTFEQQNQYPISDLTKGTYTVKIATSEGISNKKLLIE